MSIFECVFLAIVCIILYQIYLEFMIFSGETKEEANKTLRFLTDEDFKRLRSQLDALNPEDYLMEIKKRLDKVWG